MRNVDDEKEYKKKEKERVETALRNYKNEIDRTNAGYNIIRYSNQGSIRVKEFVSPNVFMEWHPRNQAYVILRLAKKGLLCYNET